jgi:hypothetical protein
VKQKGRTETSIPSLLLEFLALKLLERFIRCPAFPCEVACSAEMAGPAIGCPMTRSMTVAVSAAVSGTVASTFSTAALVLLARAEGRGAAQPTNATSHWLYGDRAAQCDRIDTAHTLVGYATHHASALFWAVPFEIWLAVRPPGSSVELFRRAGLIAGIAAGVDYGLTPRRLTPGWELVLSKKSVSATFAALALGLAAGAVIARAVLNRGVSQAEAGRRSIG